MLLSLLAAVVIAQDPQPPTTPSLLVMPLEARPGVKPELLHLLQDVVTTEARRVPGYRVVTMQDVEQMLSAEQRAQLVGCSTESCLAEIAGALQAEEILYGAVGKLGEHELVLSLNRVEPRTARALGGESERLNGRDSDAMLDGVPRLLRRLYTAYAPPPTRVQPMRGWVLGIALSALGAMLQYGMFSSIFTCSFLLLPLSPLLVFGLGGSSLLCALTPFISTWLQGWLADVVGRRQAGLRWAVLSGLAVLVAAACLAPCAGLLAASPWLVAGGRVAGIDRQQTINVRDAVVPTQWIGLLTSGSLVVLAFSMATMAVLAVGTMAAPVVQAAVILTQAKVRPDTVSSEMPHLYGPHETPPGPLKMLPRWLIGGRDVDADIEAN